MIDDIFDESWDGSADMWKLLDEWERKQVRRQRRKNMVVLLCTLGLVAAAWAVMHG